MIAVIFVLIVAVMDRRYLLLRLLLLLVLMLLMLLLLSHPVRCSHSVGQVVTQFRSHNLDLIFFTQYISDQRSMFPSMVRKLVIAIIDR